MSAWGSFLATYRPSPCRVLSHQSGPITTRLNRIRATLLEQRARRAAVSDYPAGPSDVPVRRIRIPVIIDSDDDDMDSPECK